MQLQPLVLAVLGLPSEGVDPEVVTALREVLLSGHITLLDMAVVTRRGSGEVSVFDLEDELATIGLEGFPAQDESVLLPDELAEVADALAPGRSAVVLAYEESWARRFVEDLRDRGGEVLLHAQFSVGHPDVEARPGGGTDEEDTGRGSAAVVPVVRKLESLVDSGALTAAEADLVRDALLGI
ncbi:MAG TPA: DUF6325 family protein [Dermatophilaceae bacterium]|nr:DUF6325 family protein [Dermatophilaceae bacterium]